MHRHKEFICTDAGYYHYFILAVTKRCARLSAQTAGPSLCDVSGPDIGIGILLALLLLLGISVYWIFTVYCFQRMLRVSGARFLCPASPLVWTTTAGPWLTGRSPPSSSSSRSYLAPYLQKWFLSKVDAIYLSICNFKDGEYIRVNWMAIPFALMPHGHGSAPILSHKWMKRSKEEEMYQTEAAANGPWDVWVARRETPEHWALWLISWALSNTNQPTASIQCFPTFSI